MKKLLLSTAIVSLFAMPSAYAGNSGKAIGGYAGVDAGYSYVKGDAQETANEVVDILGGAVIVIQDTRAVTGRLYAGYNINKNFAVELGYLNTADLTTTISGVSGGSVPYTGKGNVSVSGIDYSVLIKPIATKGWDGLFAKVGGHYLDSSVDVTLTGTGTVSSKSSTKGSGFLVGLGYEAPISDTFDYRVAYTYYNKVSGVSNNDANVVTVGILAKF